MKNLPAALLLEKNRLATPNPWLILLDIRLPDNTMLYVVRNTEDVVFQGRTYTAFPFEFEPTKETSKGEIPTVTLRVSNITQVFQAYLEAQDGGIGGMVTMRVVNAAYLAGLRAEDCLGLWKMDEDAWTGSLNEVIDSSGKGLHGTAQGDANTVVGRVGRAGAFDGINDCIVFSNPSSIQISSGSLLSWIKIPVSGAGSMYRGIMAKLYAYGLFLLDSEFGIWDWTSSLWYGTGRFLNDGLWHLVGASFVSGIVDGTALYIDGERVRSATMTVQNQGNDLYIGNGGWPAQWLTGYIDESAVVNRILTDNEWLNYFHGGYDYADLEMTFDILATQADALWVTFTLGAPNPLRARFPQYRYLADHCRWTFKSVECAYSGPSTTCKRTLDYCRQLGNSRRFGGFPGLSGGGVRLA